MIAFVTQHHDAHTTEHFFRINPSHQFIVIHLGERMVQCQIFGVFLDLGPPAKRNGIQRSA